MPTKPVQLRATAYALTKYIRQKELPLALSCPLGPAAKHYELTHTRTGNLVTSGLLSEIRSYLLQKVI